MFKFFRKGVVETSTPTAPTTSPTTSASAEPDFRILRRETRWLTVKSAGEFQEQVLQYRVIDMASGESYWMTPYDPRLRGIVLTNFLSTETRILDGRGHVIA